MFKKLQKLKNITNSVNKRKDTRFDRKNILFIAIN